MAGRIEVEGEGRSVAEARWAAMKQLESEASVEADAVSFETLEQSGEGAEKLVRVRATVGPPDGAVKERATDERETADAEVGEVTDEVEEEIDQEVEHNEEREVRPRREPTATDEWPEAPAERLEVLLGVILDGLDIDGDIEVEEFDEELVGSIEGDDVGLLIGKHGQTIDAVQLICSQSVFRGHDERKRVVVDAAGYRERREEMLCRQADRAASDALRYGRPVDLDSMSAQERRVVHTHLKENPDVETHSEGDEPYRCVVVSPV